MNDVFHIAVCSEFSATVTFGGTIDLETHHKVMDFNHLLLEHPFPGLIEVVPAYASVTVFFDPVLIKEKWPHQTSPARVVRTLLEEKISQSQITDQPIADQPTPIVEIPVRYDGPDLAEIAERLKLSENEIIRLHTGIVYTVFMIGFLPGFPYLGPLPEALQLPRRDTPRLRVAAGSVAIAGRQTGIYPQASPGGWHLIGHTDIRLFDAGQKPPARLQPGMQVRFVKI